MKKTHAFLLVGATCIILLGGLWSTGLLHFGPKAEKESPSDPATKSDHQAEEKKPHELIVGKWEGEREGVPAGMEFTDKGQVILLGRINLGKEKHIGGPITFGGSYRFLDDKTLETETVFGKAVQTQYQVEVTKDSLKLTGEKKTQAFKRVQDFSAALTKTEPKSSDKEATAAKVSTAQAVLTFKKHEASVEAVAISPDGALIASGGDDGIVIIWERMTGKVKHKLDSVQGRKEINRNEGVRRVAFSPDGSTVASGSFGNVMLWNVDTGKRRKGHFDGSQFVFSPDGKKLIVATFDQVHVWDLLEDKNVFSRKTPGSISSIAISPDGKLIASGDQSSYVRVWDAMTGEQTFSYKESRAQISSVAFSPDSCILAAHSDGLYLTLFDLTTSEKVLLKGPIAKKGFSSFFFLPDGKHLACKHSNDDSVRIWDLPTGQEWLILKGHTDTIKALAASADGKWLVSASQDHTVKVWDVSSVVDPPLKLVKPQVDNNVFKRRDALMQISVLSLSDTTGQSSDVWPEGFLTISQNEKYVVVYAKRSNPDVFTTYRMTLWDVGTKTLLTDFSKGKDFPSSQHVAFSRDGQSFAYCASEGVKLINLPAGNERFALPNPTIEEDPRIKFWYTSVMFSRDGKTVAACGMLYRDVIPLGGVVSVWDTAKGKIVASRNTFSNKDEEKGSVFTHLAFGPDGEKIAYSTKREVRIWHLSSISHQNALRTSVDINRLSWNESGSLLAIAGNENGPFSNSEKTLVWEVKNNRGTYVTGDAVFLNGIDLMVSRDSKGVRVVDPAHGGTLFTLFGHTVNTTVSTDNGNRLATIVGQQVTMWKIDKEAMAMVKQEMVAKGRLTENLKIFEVKDGNDIQPDGFWIGNVDGDSTFFAGNEKKLVIAIHKGTNCKQAIRLKVSSNNKRLVFSPEIHDITKDDTTTKEVVFLVRNPGERCHCTLTVTTEPPSNSVIANGFMDAKKEAKAPFDEEKAEPEKKKESKAPFDDKKMPFENKDGKKSELSVVTSPNGFTFKTFLPQNRTKSAVFSSDGKQLIVLTEDATIVAWSLGGDSPGGIDYSRKMSPVSAMLENCAISQDRQTVAWLGRFSRTIVLWDVTNGKQKTVIKNNAHNPWGLSLTSDGKRLASGGQDKTVRVWNTMSGEEEFRLLGHKEYVNVVEFSFDGKHLASGSKDKTVVIWDAVLGKQRHVLERHSDSITKVMFSPDGKQLVTLGNDNTGVVWDVATGKEIFCLRHIGHIFSASFSPDGKMLVSVSGKTGEAGEGEVKVWETGTGREIRSLKGHTDFAFQAAFSPDGKRMVTASRDKTVKVWQVSSWTEEATLKGHTDAVEGVQLSPDGLRLLTTSWDGTVKVWDIDTELRLNKKPSKKPGS